MPMCSSELRATVRLEDTDMFCRFYSKMPSIIATRKNKFKLYVANFDVVLKVHRR